MELAGLAQSSEGQRAIAEWERDKMTQAALGSVRDKLMVPRYAPNAEAVLKEYGRIAGVHEVIQALRDLQGFVESDKQKDTKVAGRLPEPKYGAKQSTDK